ncbi:MAG: 2,3-dihydroxyphenylpropionate 1,2-dioxygenase [Acidimicrobiales bacterium]|jgi:2,3-dihydroxyphenylpropionate 1,2-dioxygenase
MSSVVFGVGASHTTLMNTKWDEVDHLDRAHAFRDGLATAKAALTEAEPDLIVIVGTNHFRGFWLDLMPSLTIGVGEVVAAGEHGTPSGPQPVDPEAAVALCNHVMAADFDLTFSLRLQVDHGISHAIQYLVPDGTPTVPVVINVFAPPLPSLRRCLSLGHHLRAAIEALPGDRRVAVVGTGGLSHQLPFPDWRSPQSDDDEFLVESWLNGRGDWQQYEQRRRALIVGSPPEINEDFDRGFLARLEAGSLAGFPDDVSDGQLVELAGNGGNEARPWLAMAAACGHRRFDTVAYSPMAEWLTGMAVSMTTDAS